MRRRSLAREATLQILYQAEVIEKPIEETIEKYWADEEEKSDEQMQQFANRIALGVYTYLVDIDERISKYATNWQLSRMAIIDRNVLRMGVYEMYYADDIPPKVTINEAVDLAKKYGDMESGKFVNGILDRIHKTEILKKSDKEVE